MNFLRNNRFEISSQRLAPSVFRAALVLLLCCLQLQPVFAELLLFGDLGAQLRSDPKDSDDLDKSDLIPKATLFYSGQIGRTRILAEYTADNDDQHLGRAKLGWELGDSDTIWLGRLHNPSSYWRSQNHHGGFLQPTISRPAITEFEEKGGVVPAHLSGALVEGLYARGDGGWRYFAGAGFSPTFIDSGLDAPKIFSGSRGAHDSSLSFRVGWLPDTLAENEVGFFVSRNHIDSDIVGMDEVEQVYGGMYFNWKTGGFTFLSEAYYVGNEIYQTSENIRDGFANAYLQAGYGLNNALQLNARLEQSRGNQDDAYLARFPTFVYQRRLVSLRYDFTRHHALKLEFEHAHRQSGYGYNQLGIQWSFVLP